VPARRPPEASRSRTPGRPREPLKPKPPTSLTLATLPDHDLDNEASFAQLGFYDIDLSQRVADSVEFEQCRLRGVDLSGSQLDRVHVTDCLIENSNVANVRMEIGALVRLKCVTSRMTGLTLSKGLARDVEFTDCRLDMSSWRFTDFHAARFTNCNLTRADFTEANLTGAQFVGCDLTGAQFDKARMAGTRFSNCTLVDIGGVLSWHGAIVDSHDLIALSYTLAHALGIQIEAEAT
jgi:uncharacterized protein YjbI with pentapeptide repeats